MDKWEKEVCRRNPELNQRRLNLIEHIDKMLLESKAMEKFFAKKKLSKKEKEVIDKRLREIGVLDKDVQKLYTKNKEVKNNGKRI